MHVTERKFVDGGTEKRGGGDGRARACDARFVNWQTVNVFPPFFEKTFSEKVNSKRCSRAFESRRGRAVDDGCVCG